MSTFKRVLWTSLVLIAIQSSHTQTNAEPFIEPYLTPGKIVPTVRALACNTSEQLTSILTAYSRSYRDGQAAFEKQRKRRAFDAAVGQMAPICDEMWFKGIVPVRTILKRPFRVWFANGSLHTRYVIEAKPVGASGVPSSVSYFISSRWKVASAETSL